MRFFLILTMIIFCAPQWAVAHIVPHHASYKLHLVKIYSGMELADLSGEADFSLKQSCDAWTLSHHADMAYAYTSGERVLSHNSYSSVEDLDGKHLEFFAKQMNNNQPQTVVRGHAEYNADTQSLDISYEMNGDIVKKALSGQFVFSVKHTRNMIAHAKKGDKLYQAKLYDGAEGDTYHLVSTVIGTPKTSDGKLEWPVSMAFYKGNQTTMVPDYEMRLMLREDGIVRQMDIVYPDFTIRQSLVDLKLLEKPACD